MESTHKEKVEQVFQFYDQVLHRSELLGIVAEQRKLIGELREAIEELRLGLG